MIRAALTLLTITFSLALPAAADDAKLEFFEKNIRPVLVEHCYNCHAADAEEVRGGLLVDSAKGLLAGGDSGESIVPGKPEESLLLEALRHESYEMPPDQKLPDRVIANFEKWIADGAVDPRTGGTTIERQTIDLAEGRTFWSFQPIRLPDLPPTTDLSDQSDSSDPSSAAHAWPRTIIDRFIAAKHAEHGLRPAPDAPANIIARRLYFGLIGLPPTSDQLQTFEADYHEDADRAVETLVDELLASRHFGERWGRHWLDVTRFAESSGGGRSLMFTDAWRFRDYVIESFNEDKPFDQLIREHIAGDLLPHDSPEQFDEQVTGVGYLTLGPTNYELQDKQLLRMEIVDEQIDTVGRTFLGLTLGCARCHDHKFDPIPTADYYALAGIFRSTKTMTPGNVAGYVTTSLKTGYDKTALAEWQQTDRQLKSRIVSLKKQLGGKSLAKQKNIDPETLPGIIVDDTHAKFTGQWTQSAYQGPFIGEGYHHDANMKSGKGVRYEVRIPEADDYRVGFAYNSSKSRCSEMSVRIEHANGAATVVVDQRKTPDIDGVFTNLGTYRFEAGQKAVVSINAANSSGGYLIADALQFLPVSEIVAAEEASADNERVARLQTELKSLEDKLKEHSKAKPAIPKAMKRP